MRDGALFPKIFDAYTDMMFVALSAGISRVATLQLANSSGNALNFGAFVPGIPVKGTGYKSSFRNWHDLGHNPSMGGVNHKVIVDKWCMDKLSTFIGKLKSVKEPTARACSTTAVLWGNHMESGDNHGSQKFPGSSPVTPVARAEDRSVQGRRHHQQRHGRHLQGDGRDPVSPHMTGTMGI